MRGINLMMESDFHEPINLGNPDEMTILQIAKEIIELIPGTQEQDRPPADAAGRSARPLPGHHAGQADPRLDADGAAQEGLAKMIEFYREQLR